jgi:hypothetical protein
MKAVLIKTLLSIVIFTNNLTKNRPFLTSDKEAFKYSLTHTNTFIAIIWPLVQKNIAAVEHTLASWGTVCYKKKKILSPERAYSILFAAHRNARAAANKTNHYNWYFPKDSLIHPARIYLMEFSSLKSAIACKHAVRRMFNLQYRPIHINDTHTETLELAELLFSLD